MWDGTTGDLGGPTHLAKELESGGVYIVVGDVEQRDDPAGLGLEGHGERARGGRDGGEGRGVLAHGLLVEELELGRGGEEGSYDVVRELQVSGVLEELGALRREGCVSGRSGKTEKRQLCYYRQVHGSME